MENKMENKMSTFRRYKSIENHYREKFIHDTLAFHPVYLTVKYIATEKIHGANFQINFHRAEDNSISVSFGKRSSFIASSENFYNHLGTLNKPEYQTLIENVCHWMRSNGYSDVIMYGEFAGPGVQSGVDYGPTKFVKFFDVVLDGEYQPWSVFLDFMGQVGGIDFVVPVAGEFDTLEEALAFDVEGKLSIINPVEGNVWEGVVIKPLNVIDYNKDGEQVLFYIKKKDSRFADKQKKSKDTRADLPQELLDAQHAFNEYLTEVRLQDVFSKYGPIQSQKDVSTYIKYRIEDGKEDFFKDCKELFMAVDDKNKAKVFSATGKIVAPMIMKLI